MRDATLTTGALPETLPLPQPAIGSSVSTSNVIVRTILASLDDSKAEDIITIDLRGKTALADQMMIATGRSTTHVGAIADKVIRACKSAGLSSPRVEGLPQCDWVLIDASDVIVHIFRPEVRAFYNLEKMWGGDRPLEMKLV
jgi:ribosome-associated protein